MFRRLAAYLSCCLVLSSQASTVVFLGAPSDSELFAAAFPEMRLPEGVEFRSYCVSVDDRETMLADAERADVLILNARSRELRGLAEGGALSGRRGKLYALSSHLLKKETAALEPPEVSTYRANRDPENFRNMVRWIVRRECKVDMDVAPPSSLPETGATHPAAGKVFPTLPEYRKWAAENGHFREGAGVVAFAVHSASINPTEMALFRHVADECEKQDLNIVIVYGDEVRVIRELLLDGNGKAAVDAVLALSFKFRSGLGDALKQALRDLDVPVFNALRLYRQTTGEWRASERGMNDFSVAFGFIAPEISGLIEPSLLFGSRDETGKNGEKLRVSEPFSGQIAQTVARLKKWIALRRTPNRDKRVAVFLYNSSGGKQNIGASYLNVPRSVRNIVRALASAGYRTGGLELLDENALTDELLRNCRNVGSWAPGELEALLSGGEALRLPLETYKRYFRELPEELRRSVIGEWGEPENARIMVSGNDFVIPVLRRGNLAILPEPMRGYLDDAHKLVHSRTLPPPHQYLAAYLFLQHEFHADAMIHLGRHGSSEWLPGKQLGLSYADAPMVVRGDIPEIYPYIADGIGEGIIAKRRGQAVIIDHLTPLLRLSGEGDEILPELRRKLAECQTADPAVRKAREAALLERCEASGLGAKLALTPENLCEKLEDYLESRSAPAPFGLHAFGQAPGAEELRLMLALLPEKERADAAEKLKSSGEDELRSLLRALDGRFIPPGPSGDPLRRSGVLPVGRNFYSFDPALIPTPEAMKQGAIMAEELLAREKRRLGRFPRSAGVILWAGESVRTDGVNEAMALSLMGMTLRYDRSGRIAGVMPIPGARLGRPRVDVLLTASGAYRDQFGDTMRLLDAARRQAARLSDAENFIRGDVPGVFCPAPGTYGTRLNRLAGASGMWESDDELADLYLNNMSFFLDEKGELSSGRGALEEAASRVESVVHSRSSNVYGVADIDDMYQYLGGLSLAVRKTSGSVPSGYISDLRKRSGGRLAGLKNFLRAEMDARYFDREWISAMTSEGYAGGKTIARAVDNLWGWQAAAPENMTPAAWGELYDVYVLDRHKLDLKKFFSGRGEWAFQSITARMLEAVRKGYWDAPENVRQNLAVEYARSVIRQGVACCDHTCNNPMLHQMVVNIISMPGVMSPELVAEFKIAVEKSGGGSLETQLQKRREMRKKLSASSPGGRERRRERNEDRRNADGEKNVSGPSEGVPVKGYKLEKTENRAEKTELPSAGMKWSILACVFLLLAVFAAGFLKKDG